MKHSRSFLYAIYQKYPNRACENLGVSADGEEEETDLSENDYPSEFKTFTKEEQEEYVRNSGMTDEEYLAQFQDFQ